MDCDPINSRQRANSLKFNQTKCWRFVTSLPPLALPIFHSFHHVFVHVDFHLVMFARRKRCEREKGSDDEDVLDRNSWAAGINLIPHRLARCGLWVSLLLLNSVSTSSEGLLDWFSVIMWTETMPQWRHWYDKILTSPKWSDGSDGICVMLTELITRACVQRRHSAIEPTSERKKSSTQCTFGDPIDREPWLTCSRTRRHFQVVAAGRLLIHRRIHARTTQLF